MCHACVPERCKKVFSRFFVPAMIPCGKDLFVAFSRLADEDSQSLINIGKEFSRANTIRRQPVYPPMLTIECYEWLHAIRAKGGVGHNHTIAPVLFCDIHTSFHHISIQISTRLRLIASDDMFSPRSAILYIWGVADNDIKAAIPHDVTKLCPLERLMAPGTILPCLLWTDQDIARVDIACKVGQQCNLLIVLHLRGQLEEEA